jgi:stress response protein YsnF
MTTPLDIKKLLGARMIGAAGEELGSIEQVFFDDTTGAQEWARLRMGGLLGGKDRFVPLFGGKLEGKDMKVPYDKQRVKDSPDLVVDRHITPEQESRLRTYYGLGPAGSKASGRTTSTTTTSSTGKATTAAAAGIATAAAAGNTDRNGARTGEAVRNVREVRREQAWVERFEERIGFRTEDIETGRIRLHKYVDVIPVEERVRLMHEEFELERIPIKQGQSDFREDHVEIVLRGQHVVAIKHIVPIERVRLNIRQVPEERVIHEEIRRERIEVERLEGSQRANVMKTTGDLSGRSQNIVGAAADTVGDVLDGAKDVLSNGMGRVRGLFDGK